MQKDADIFLAKARVVRKNEHLFRRWFNNGSDGRIVRCCCILFLFLFFHVLRFPAMVCPYRVGNHVSRFHLCSFWSHFCKNRRQGADPELRGLIVEHRNGSFFFILIAVSHLRVYGFIVYMNSFIFPSETKQKPLGPPTCAAGKLETIHHKLEASLHNYRLDTQEKVERQTVKETPQPSWFVICA